MEREQAEYRLSRIQAEQWDQLDSLTSEIAADSYDGPIAVAKAWIGAKDEEREKCRQALLNMGALSVIAWLAAAKKLNGLPRITALTEAVTGYLVIQEALVGELSKMLHSKEKVPVQEVAPTIQPEEHEPPSRECENAYCLLRRIFKTDDTEWVAEVTRRILLRMEESEADQVIAEYNETGHWKKFVRDPIPEESE